jgi:hypothetical protein
MPQPNRFVTARISFRKGSTPEWEGNDPILMAGEPAYNTTLKKLKLGDGTSKWSELPYLEGLGGVEWSNDGSGLFPSFIETSDQAINYLMYHHDLLEDNALAYFQAGINGETFNQLFELVVSANNGGSASISGTPKDYNSYPDGGQVEIKAVASSPYTFSGWTGLISGEADTATTTITMSEARNLIANFTS